jgi:hypothetical protein
MTHDTLEARPMTPAAPVEPAIEREERERREQEAAIARARAKRPVRKFRQAPDELRSITGGARSAPPGIGGGSYGPAPAGAASSALIGNLFRAKVMESTALKRVGDARQEATDRTSHIVYGDEGHSVRGAVSRAILSNPRDWTHRVAALQVVTPMAKEAPAKK